MEHPNEKIIHAYVDQMLDPREKEALLSHLSRCPSCRHEVEALTSLFEELAHLPSPRPNRRLTTRILLATQHEKWKNITSFDLSAFLFGGVGWAAAAVGLLCGILLGLSVSNTWISPSTPLESSYTDPTDMYEGYLISDNGDIL